jgi:hypothetical protein
MEAEPIAARRGRERCPTCGAGRDGKALCRRCGSDLRLLAAVEAEADRRHQAALAAYRRGWFRLAAERAAAAIACEARPESLRLYAVAALRGGDFAAAAKAARRALRGG